VAVTTTFAGAARETSVGDCRGCPMGCTGHVVFSFVESDGVDAVLTFDCPTKTCVVDGASSDSSLTFGDGGG
jgi:hypothetical protein